MGFHIVVARYRENISWLPQFVTHLLTSGCGVETFVYDKSDTPLPDTVPLPNIGREAHTYLYYIIEHYENLPEAVIFLQGDPFPHTNVKNVHDWNISNSSDLHGFVPFFADMRTEHHEEDRLKSTYKLPVWKKMNQHLGYTVKDVTFAIGAQFIVSRDAILVRPKSFYQTLIEKLCSFEGQSDLSYNDVTFNEGDTIDAWTLERMWPYIFDQKHQP